VGGERNKNAHRFYGETAQQDFHSMKVNGREDKRRGCGAADVPDARGAMTVRSERTLIMVVMVQVAGKQCNRHVQQTDRECACLSHATAHTFPRTRRKVKSPGAAIEETRRETLPASLFLFVPS